MSGPEEQMNGLGTCAIATGLTMREAAWLGAVESRLLLGLPRQASQYTWLLDCSCALTLHNRLGPSYLV